MNNVKQFRAGNFFKYICKSFDYEIVDQQGNVTEITHWLKNIPKEILAKIAYGVKLSWNKGAKNENTGDNEVAIVDITDQENPVRLVMDNSSQDMINPLYLLNLADQLQSSLLGNIPFISIDDLSDSDLV